MKARSWRESQSSTQTPSTASSLLVVKVEERGLERALYEKQRPGADALLEDSEEQRISAMVCSDLPEGFARWTVRLVAEKAVKRRLVPRVGKETIRIRCTDRMENRSQGPRQFQSVSPPDVTPTSQNTATG